MSQTPVLLSWEGQEKTQNDPATSVAKSSSVGSGDQKVSGRGHRKTLSDSNKDVDQFKAALSRTINQRDRRAQDGDMPVDHSPPSVTVSSAPSRGHLGSFSELASKSMQSVQSFGQSFEMVDESDSLLPASLSPGGGEVPNYAKIKEALKRIPEMNRIRSQLEEQLVCLDRRLEQQQSQVGDIQDFFTRRAYVERQYARELESLASKLLTKHSFKFQKNDSASTSDILQQLVEETGRTGRVHSTLAEVFEQDIKGRCGVVDSDLVRVFKQCREAGGDIQKEVLWTLYDMTNKNKTLELAKATLANADLKLADAQKGLKQLEKKIPPQDRPKNKKFVKTNEEHHTRLARYNDARLKSVQAQSDYLLSVEAANASLKRYFTDDISDLINCMDHSFHKSLIDCILTRSSAIEQVIISEQNEVEVMKTAIKSLDSRNDKEIFLSRNTNIFASPEKFDSVLDSQLHPPLEEQDAMKRKLAEIIKHLRTASDQKVKQVENDEQVLIYLMDSFDHSVSSTFDNNSDEIKKREASREKNRKILASSQETYLRNCKDLMMINNKIEQEEAKYNAIKKILVKKDFCDATLPRPGPKKRRTKTQTTGPMKLFGGGLDEYFDYTGDMLPSVVESCIRVISQHGMAHSGIFRIGGSHVEISKYEEEFERGEDPFANMKDANQMNSVSGVLKLYFRKLSEPIISNEYFDQFMDITKNFSPGVILSVMEKREKKIGPDIDFVVKCRSLITEWSAPHFVVARYLFCFLSHLSENSEEHHMDPYNIAICFGPNLCPIPDGKDMVLYTNLVNDLVKNFIIFAYDIFDNRMEGPKYDRGDEADLFVCGSVPEDFEEEEEFKTDDQMFEDEPGQEGQKPKELKFREDQEVYHFSQDERKDTTDMDGALKGPADTNTLSFRSTRSMFENTLERPVSKFEEKKKSVGSISSSYAPDLLQDLLNRSPGSTSPLRSRTSSTSTGMSPTRWSSAPRDPPKTIVTTSAMAAAAANLKRTKATDTENQEGDNED